MKVLLKYVLVIGLFFATTAYSYSYEKIEFYNDPAEACCMSNHFMGLYLGANAGYSWYNFFLHRPAEDDLSPLLRPQWKLNNWVPILTVGYDLYPRRKIPLRFEINLTYDDDHFTNDPLFVDPLEDQLFAHDEFRLYNAMVSLYFDMHTCSRFVPFIGVSGGYEVLVTDHQPENRLIPEINTNFDNTDHHITWGGTIGSRFFITNHFIANLQFRFNDLKEIAFKNRSNLTLPSRKDYSSDYFHETTILFGLAYEF